MKRKLVLGFAWALGLALLVVAVWMVAIGPVAVWRVLTNGTTTVWDHEKYPGRSLLPAPVPSRWLTSDEVDTDTLTSIESDLVDSSTLAFMIISDHQVVVEWYAGDHDPERPVMLFSVTKSLLSILIGTAIEDGLIASVTDRVSDYLPEMRDGGLDGVTIEQLLTMDSSLAYVEGDNPFGEHVMFNYTADLEGKTLRLSTHDQSEQEFRYKSGDYAVLGLLLDRVLGEQSVTGYLQTRIWDRIGATGSGTWSTDHEDGLERAWCCLAMTARDLARFGQLILSGGVWGDDQVVPESWVIRSLAPAFSDARWPAEYADSPLANYGYGWWQSRGGGWLGLGKDGQYLYIDRANRRVIVRQGESSGDFSWVERFDNLD